MLEKILKLIKPFFIALIGVCMANSLNVFDYISLVPSNNAFDLCITVYFAILDIFSDIIIKAVQANYVSRISVILSQNNTEITIVSNPVITFNRSDLAEATMSIKITGRKKHFANSQIILSNVNFATMQANSNNREVSIDNNGNYVVDLEKMFGTTDMRTTIESSFRISFVKEPVDGERSCEIIPELKKKNLRCSWICYKSNKLVLRTER